MKEYLPLVLKTGIHEKIVMIAFFEWASKFGKIP